MHGPLVVTPERLVAMCILGHRLPSAFVGEVHVLTPWLFLHRLVKIMDPWGV
jgi:predicted membrane-bound mannosyltransferase